MLFKQCLTRKHPDWKDLKRGMVPQVQAPAKLSMVELWSKGLPEDLQKCMTKKGYMSRKMCRVQARLGFAFNFVVALLEKLVDFLFNLVLGAPWPSEFRVDVLELSMQCCQFCFASDITH